MTEEAARPRGRGRVATPVQDEVFDPDCRRCPRLAAFLDEVRATLPRLLGAARARVRRPEPRILVVGLAPGLHGANRTGRPFTGDFAGILLYETLHAVGLGTQAGVGVGRRPAARCAGCASPTPSSACRRRTSRCRTRSRAATRFLKAELAGLPSVRVRARARRHRARRGARCDGPAPRRGALRPRRRAPPARTGGCWSIRITAAATTPRPVA